MTAHPYGSGSAALRRATFAAKGRACWWCGRPATTVDHVLAVVLGGTNDPANLVPANYRGFLNADDKDRLENYLHDAVCSGQMRLQAAQEAIAADWVKAYCAARLGECPAGLR